MSVQVKLKQLELLSDLSKYFTAFPEKSNQALRIAMNDVGGRSGLSMFKREMLSEVAFPSGYLNNERLSLDKRATENDLSITVSGRDRPTSLARFVTNEKAGALNVRVDAGSGGKVLQGTFLVDLNNSNKGLAVRLKKGDSLRNTHGAKPLTRKGSSRPSDANVFLLYAPSVDQVFRGVADDHSGEFLQMIEAEFLRQLERLTNE